MRFLGVVGQPGQNQFAKYARQIVARPINILQPYKVIPVEIKTVQRQRIGSCPVGR